MSLNFHSTDTALRAPQAIIFDTDNTLYAYGHPHACATAAAEEKAVRLLGCEVGDVRQAFSQARQEVKRRLGRTASSHSRLLYFQRGIELLGRKTQLVITLDLEQTYWRTFLAHCELFPGVREFLMALRSRGIGTAIITDLTSQIQFRKIIYFGLDDCFDYVVTSEEAGAVPIGDRQARDRTGADLDDRRRPGQRHRRRTPLRHHHPAAGRPRAQRQRPRSRAGPGVRRLPGTQPLPVLGQGRRLGAAMSARRSRSIRARIRSCTP